MATLLPDRTIFISGLSKSHAMTGYRMGYFAGPKEAIDNITKLHSFLVTSITDSTQAAAIEAYTNGDEDPVKARAIYQKRRDYVLKSLNDMGIETVPPQGAFYIFAKIPASYGTDDMQFALDLAKEPRSALRQVMPLVLVVPAGYGCHTRLLMRTCILPWSA